MEEEPKSIEELLGMHNVDSKLSMMRMMRGMVINDAVEKEALFNELILDSNEPDKVTVGFRKKAEFIKKLIQGVDKDKRIFDEDSLKKLESYIIIRNLFAHVPINVFSAELEFETEKHYHSFFKRRLELKNVKLAYSEFMKIGKELRPRMDKVLEMIKENLSKKQ